MKKFELAMQTGLVPRTSDTGKDITLRNASEHKRLEGHLKHLDYQLRSKLVSMQAEIMELKASQYGQSKKLHKKRSPRLLEARDRANSDGRLNQQKGRPRTFTNDKLTNTNSPLASPSTAESTDQKDSKKELLLPEINTKQTSLVGLNPTKSCANDRNSFPPEIDFSKKRTKYGGLSPVDNVLLNIPSPSAIYRPNSLPDLSRLGLNNHGGGGGGVSPRSARRVQFTLPEKLGETNAIAKEKHIKEPAKENPALSEPPNTLEERINEFCKQEQDVATVVETPATEDDAESKNNSEEKDAKNINLDENDVFYNSMLAKGTMENGLENTPDLASLGFMDFNDVIDKRLKQTQEELPSEEEMRKIRYLRWRQEAPQLDLVKTVFEKSDDLDKDRLKNDSDADDSRPILPNDNDKDNNRLNSSKS